MADPVRKRQLTLRLRRRVKVSRRFDVLDLGDGCERQTCRECGVSIVVDHCKTGAAIETVTKLIVYRTTGGVTGVCPTCSKRLAAERYPLPE